MLAWLVRDSKMQKCSNHAFCHYHHHLLDVHLCKGLAVGCHIRYFQPSLQKWKAVRTTRKSAALSDEKRLSEIRWSPGKVKNRKIESRFAKVNVSGCALARGVLGYYWLSCSSLYFKNSSGHNFRVCSCTLSLAVIYTFVQLNECDAGQYLAHPFFETIARQWRRSSHSA